jgi:hypothetical protein
MQFKAPVLAQSSNGLTARRGGARVAVTNANGKEFDGG